MVAHCHKKKRRLPKPKRTCVHLKNCLESAEKDGSECVFEAVTVCIEIDLTSGVIISELSGMILIKGLVNVTSSIITYFQ